MELAALLIGGVASFIGSYSAIKVHLHYMRRDVDDLNERMERLEKHVF